MAAEPWNHNIHYHPLVMRVVPSDCRRALDVGCGSGLLARRLAAYSGEVTAIDIDRPTLALATSGSASALGVTFVEGDVMSYPFPEESFDLIAAVASLHHLPLRPALLRFRTLLRSDGVLAIVGLYRARTPADYAFAAAAFPVSWLLRCTRSTENVQAPLRDPEQSLDEIRSAGEKVLPGCVVRRHLLFRYSLIWHKTAMHSSARGR